MQVTSSTMLLNMKYVKFQKLWLILLTKVQLCNLIEQTFANVDIQIKNRQ